nr:MAG TPA: hypothetical protein [Caudoviricetes sp.]
MTKLFFTASFPIYLPHFFTKMRQINSFLGI